MLRAQTLQGEKAETNFPLDIYAERFDQLRAMDFKDLVAALKQHGRGGVPRVPKVSSSHTCRFLHSQEKFTDSVKKIGYVSQIPDDDSAFSQDRSWIPNLRPPPPPPPSVRPCFLPLSVCLPFSLPILTLNSMVPFQNGQR